MSTKEFQLQELLDIQWGDTNTTKASYVPEGYLAFSASGPDGFLEKFDYDGEGIVLSAIGANCGSTFFATGKWSCIKNTIRILPKSESVDLRYFYYMTKSPDFWPIRGSAQPFISQTDIREMFADFPDIEVQRNVADLLSRIDRLIKVNQKLSSLLEAIAKTIFASWFIDFDPVKAKMAGEEPVGMDAETTMLFPDSMEQSELGEIPSGWRVSKVGSSVQLAGGATPSTSTPEFWDGEYSWLTPKDLSGRRQKIAPLPSRKITLRGLERISSGLLEKGTVLLSSRAPIGYTAICAKETAVNQGFIALKADELFPPMYLLNWVESNMQEILNRAGGATFAEVSKAAFRDIPFLCPDEKILFHYREVTAPMVDHLEVLANENLLLAELRDALLPRLVSGELEIPDEMLAEL
jgi:type I restriction enzyme S subunit